jgi:hypothetical protein
MTQLPPTPDYSNLLTAKRHLTNAVHLVFIVPHFKENVTHPQAKDSIQKQNNTT